MTDDQFGEMLTELPPLLARLQRGLGETRSTFAGHEFAKYLYRMGYRRVEAPQTNACRRCGTETVTAQAICIDCRDPEGRGR